ncbi:deoxyribonuclease-1-like protein [Flavobacterium sp. PL11]|jgi:deoxyribonuclease-1-like protein|uniref:endonuclease/exonuclease/phosphatase family protein n=1 Tax=Flavobacterium sp. PL11 TaxID=3071717 RepID=UPI002DFDBB88|nr:deoxyribonuclease-1-like protein [Flavobacterium sp. PL11]
MKNTISICLLFFITIVNAQPTLLSWNISNLGKSKSNSEIAFMAATIRDYDIIAIQEVVAGNGGAQAVARLADELNRKGSKWDYTISDPTSGSPNKSERYAFIWKTSKVKIIGKAWLEKKYHLEIEREPYLCTFEYGKKQFTVVNFHAIPKKSQPETEIKYFKYLPADYPKLNLIFVGDFNCPQSHSVFNPLKQMGYKSVLVGQKTSLKTACTVTECLASEYDNIFYNSSKVNIVQSGVLHFYTNFDSLKEARLISDHIPIWFQFSLAK